LVGFGGIVKVFCEGIKRFDEVAWGLLVGSHVCTSCRMVLARFERGGRVGVKQLRYAG
jgi:hypothetical protein